MPPYHALFLKTQQAPPHVLILNTSTPVTDYLYNNIKLCCNFQKKNKALDVLSQLCKVKTNFQNSSADTPYFFCYFGQEIFQIAKITQVEKIISDILYNTFPN